MSVPNSELFIEGVALGGLHRFRTRVTMEVDHFYRGKYLTEQMPGFSCCEKSEHGGMVGFGRMGLCCQSVKASKMQELEFGPW